MVFFSLFYGRTKHASLQIPPPGHLHETNAKTVFIANIKRRTFILDTFQVAVYFSESLTGDFDLFTLIVLKGDAVLVHPCCLAVSSSLGYLAGETGDANDLCCGIGCEHFARLKASI